LQAFVQSHQVSWGSWVGIVAVLIILITLTSLDNTLIPHFRGAWSVVGRFSVVLFCKTPVPSGLLSKTDLQVSPILRFIVLAHIINNIVILHEYITNIYSLLVFISSGKAMIEDWYVTSVWEIIKVLSFDHHVGSFNFELVILEEIV
jgi:hypothetical protein